MDNNYYKPTIEEFHVGFEYEVEETFWHHTPPQHTGKWSKSIYEMGCAIEALLFIDAIRVKFLDADDIKELGWNEINIDPEGSWIEAKIKKSDYCWELFYEVNFQMVSLKDSTNYYCTEFYGGCKNKSELRKLMSQLDIQS